MATAFLSHSSFDKAFAKKLAETLKQEGHTVWFDDWEIQVGEEITSKIQKAISEYEYLIILLSPEALNSHWVESEWQAKYWIDKKHRKKNILPVMLRECERPVLLEGLLYADFTNEWDDGFVKLNTRLKGSQASAKPTEEPSINQRRIISEPENIDEKSPSHAEEKKAESAEAKNSKNTRNESTKVTEERKPKGKKVILISTLVLALVTIGIVWWNNKIEPPKDSSLKKPITAPAAVFVPPTVVINPPSKTKDTLIEHNKSTNTTPVSTPQKDSLTSTGSQTHTPEEIAKEIERRKAAGLKKIIEQ